MYLICRELRVFLLVPVLAVTIAPARAQPAGSPQTSSIPNSSVLDDPLVREAGKRGLDMLYNMQFEGAEVVFNKIEARYPRHPIGPFLNALSLWWQILLDLEDTSHDDAFFEAMDEVAERSERLLDRNPNSVDGAFFKALALGFSGRLHADRGHWFRAALDAKRAMDYALSLAERAPRNPDFTFGKGIYDYFAAVVPERHPYVKPIMYFFPDGNRQRGLRLLRRTAEQGWFIQTEAAYFLTQIYYIYEEDFSQSLHYVTWLREEHPNNPYFHNLEGRIYARWGRWRRARDIFKEVIARHARGAPGYNAAMYEQALYYTARSYLVYDRYRAALPYLARLEKSATRTEDDTRYEVLGRLRQGMVYDALGRRKIAVDRYRSVLEMDDHAGAHDRAEHFLEEPFRG